MRKKIARQLIIIVLSLLMLCSCTTVSITGRKQLNLVPDSLMHSMSFQQYSSFLSENKVSSDTNQSEMVKRVGTRIQKAVEKYCAENNCSDRLAGYKWEFNLVQNDTPNAWAMPGGKVVIYTGILPITQTEAGLAVVMAHEIAHAFAKHGAERMSHSLLAELGGVALSVAVKDQPEKTQALFRQAYGVGAQVGVLLPYSRIQESEADHLGLIFMAMAGYDPHEAVDFWQRMKEMSKDKQAPPEFLSTHPAPDTRIEDIKALIPEAMKHYQPPSPTISIAAAI